MKSTFLTLVASALVLASCGGSEAPATEETQATAPAPQETQVVEDANVVELTIEANDQMKFNLSTLEVAAGSKVKLTLKNVGELPKEAMGHNWTLLQAGVDLQSFAMAAMAAKDNDYMPADRMSDVVAHTAILGPKEEQTIEFDAPAPGSYTYLCTFPGHYGIMKGTFTVR